MASTMPAVVGHMGSRDHYQLALALREAGLLTSLVTEVLVPEHVPRALAARMPRLAGQLRKRSCVGLAEPLKLMPSVLAMAMFTRFLENPARIWAIADRQIGIAALNRAKATSSSLFLYSYYAYEAFREAETLGIPRILFQLHPHPLECRSIYQEELERVPSAAASLLLEKEMSISEEELQRLAAEPALADHIVVASSFTKETLTSQGVDESRISVIPYGVDGEQFPTRQTPRSMDGPLRIGFLGSFIQRKGVSYLVEAVNSFSPSDVKLVVATRAIDRDALPPGATSQNVEFRLGLSRAELPEFLHTCDVFALPSLAEGFGLSLVEAMSAGLPAIATPNTCAADIMEDGKSGFLVPIRDAQAIAGAIQQCLDRRKELFEMGQEAARTVAALTWQRFRSGIAKDYSAFMTDLH